MTDRAHVDRRLELVATVLLALAAVATAWATYQASRWHGQQAEAQSASIAARVESTRMANVANRQAQVDVSLFTQWIDATAQGDGKLAAFYRKRFRDEFEPAFDAWIATRPLENENAPLTPFAMPQYRLAALEQAAQDERRANELSTVVKTNVQRADNYMLAVVLFAASLFFAGISTKLHQVSARVAILVFGWVLFTSTLIWVATFPVTVSL
jgi:hypothetical protein